MGRFATARAIFVTGLIAAGLFAPMTLQAQETIKIGTGSPSGIYISLGTAICKTLNARATGLNCEALPSKGSIANLIALKKGEIHLGIVQSDVQHDAVTGTGTFAKIGKQPMMRSLFSAHAESLAIATRRDSGIRTLEDLVGRKLDIGKIRSGTNATMRLLFKELGWTKQTFGSLAALPVAEQRAALCDGKVEATSFLAGHPNGMTNALISKCDATLVEISGPVVNQMIARNPFYVPALIPRDSYIRLDRDVNTIGLLATVVSTDKVDPRITYLVTKAVFENLSYIRGQRDAFRRLHPFEMARKGLTAPRHRGAEKYLQEVGRLP